MSLSFDDLRLANTARLPQFKNAKGEPAHSEPDGSDWPLDAWSNALTGEVGEAANIIKKLRRGDYTLDETPAEFKGKTVRQALESEFADIVTYLDLLAMQLGTDLGAATIAKFNEVSDRVGSNVRISRFGSAQLHFERP